MTDLKAISQWLIQPSSPLQAFYVINGSIEDNATFVEPVQGVEVVERYIDGTAEFYVDYGVNTFKMGDENMIFSPTDTENNDNITDYDEVKKLLDWVRKQNNIGNLPVDIDNWQVLSIEPTNALPRYAGTDDQNLSKYMAFIRVRYYGVV